MEGMCAVHLTPKMYRIKTDKTEDVDFTYSLVKTLVRNVLIVFVVALGVNATKYFR